MNWNSRESKETFTPCDYCNYLANENGDKTICEHCDYAIILYCLSNNVQSDKEEKINLFKKV